MLAEHKKEGQEINKNLYGVELSCNMRTTHFSFFHSEVCGRQRAGGGGGL
jgi:hypothetical protein